MRRAVAPSFVCRDLTKYIATCRRVSQCIPEIKLWIAQRSHVVDASCSSCHGFAGSDDCSGSGDASEDLPEFSFDQLHEIINMAGSGFAAKMGLPGEHFSDALAILKQSFTPEDTEDRQPIYSKRDVKQVLTLSAKLCAETNLCNRSPKLTRVCTNRTSRCSQLATTATSFVVRHSASK